jgi:type I restriction enzyme S subunit
MSINDTPADWKHIYLGDIVTDVAMGPFGSNLKVDNFIDEGVPVIRGANLHSGGFNRNEFVFVSEEKAQSLKRSLAYPDDLVFTHRGTLGQVGLIPKDRYPKYLVSQSQMRLTVNKEHLFPKFLYYFFKSPFGQRELLKNASQVGVPAIANPTKSLKQVRVIVPTLPEQKRIADFLSTLDEKIDLNLRMNENLERITQAIFTRWFIDFQFPGFDGELVNNLPRKWLRGKVKEICELNSKSLGAKDKLEQIKYVEISEVNRGVINNLSLYMRGEEPSRAKRRLTHGDTVLSTVRPDRGSYFLALNPTEDIIASTGFAVFSPQSVPYSYLYLFLTNAEQLAHYGRVADGAAYPSINPKLIMEMNIVIPDENILSVFHSVAEPIFERMNINLEECNVLVNLRDQLLSKLLSGQIRVSEY